MPTLVSTQTFSNGNILSAAALTNHVIDAKPLATFISGQDAVASPAPADEFLIATAGASPAKKVTFANIVSNLPTGTTAVDLTVSGATTLNGALSANGNTIIGDAASDTLTVNATSNFGDATFGGAVVNASWTRSTTTLTVSKTAHGLTSGNSRYFVFTGTSATPVASSVLNGTYSVVVTSANAFTIVVANVGDTVGNVKWYEKSLTLSSTLTGPLQGDIPVNVASVDLDSGDEFLIRDSSNLFRLKAVNASSFFVPKAFGCVALHSATVLTVSGTGTRALSSTTVNINKASHGMRTGDVLYIPAVTGPPAFVAGWYIATRVDADNFTITTAANTAASWSLTWYEHVSPGAVSNSTGNVYSAFGNAATSGATAVQFNFTNKPPTTSYCLNLTVTTGSNNQTLTMPICGVGAGGSTGLNAAYFKTVNGFGVGVLSYAGGAAPVEADSFLNFTAIW